MSSRFCCILTLILLLSMLVGGSSFAPKAAQASPRVQGTVSDPSGVTVGTSTLPYATAYNAQPKSFFASSMFWAFYDNGTGLMVGTSTDGIKWNNSATPLGNSPLPAFSGSASASGSGAGYAIWFDGKYFQTVYAPYAYDDNVYYARALPLANGSIIWGTIQVVISGQSSDCWYYPHICTDSSGRPWTMYCNLAGNGSFADNIDVIYSTTSNGSWTTASGFPKVLSRGVSDAILPLTNDKMYAVWENSRYGNQGFIQGAMYNGSSFGSTETIYSIPVPDWSCAVACGDTVVSAFLAGDGSNNLLSTVRNNTTSTWSSPTVIQPGNKNSLYEWVAPELSVDPATKTLYCFWVGNPDPDYVYYSSCSLPSETWSTPTAWLYEPSISGIYFLHWCIMSFYQANGGYMGLEYTTGSSSTWYVRFAYLSVVVKTPTFISLSTSASSSFVGFSVNLMGKIHDVYGNGLSSVMVVLYYSVSGISTWTPIASASTDSFGNYSAMWIPTGTGYFDLKAEWAGNATFALANATVTLSALPYANQYVFSVESNSTISNLAFNSQTNQLDFTASGPSGTIGYTKVTIAKSLVSNITGLQVTLDGASYNYTVLDANSSWVLTITYHHSSHTIVINLPTAVPEFSPFLVLPFFIIATLAVALILKKKRQEAISG